MFENMCQVHSCISTGGWKDDYDETKSFSISSSFKNENENFFICLTNGDVSLSQQPKDNNIEISNDNSQK